MTHAELLERMNWRYAVKRFDPSKRIPEDTLRALEEALVLTPSSYGLQPWRFIVVASDELKARLMPLSWNQKQVAECSHYVVLQALTEIREGDVDRFFSRIQEVRGTPVEALAGYRKSIVGDVIHGARSKWAREWATRQVYIALGNLMTAAAMIGVDACPMEGIEPEKYDEALGSQGTGYHTVVACALGYRSAEDKYQSAKKVRYAIEDVVFRR